MGLRAKTACAEDRQVQAANGEGNLELGWSLGEFPCMKKEHTGKGGFKRDNIEGSLVL